MHADSMWRKFETLPAVAQKQIIDYIDFLESRYVDSKAKVKVKNRSLADEEFIGIWENRKDMTDSSQWVKNLRQNEWNQ